MVRVLTIEENGVSYVCVKGASHARCFKVVERDSEVAFEPVSPEESARLLERALEAIEESKRIQERIERSVREVENRMFELVAEIERMVSETINEGIKRLRRELEEFLGWWR